MKLFFILNKTGTIQNFQCQKRLISYVPIYAGDYNNLKWYHKDLNTYFDYLNYKEMAENTTNYFHDKHVLNFDIIHHECCGDKLENSYKNYKTISEK